MTRPLVVSARASRRDAGVTLVELLVAHGARAAWRVGTVAMLASAVLAGFEADPAAADEQQRGRAAINALVDDVQRAGSGFVQAPDDGPGVGLPALLPDAVAPGAWVTSRRAAHALERASAAQRRARQRCARPPRPGDCRAQAGPAGVLFGRRDRRAGSRPATTCCSSTARALRRWLRCAGAAAARFGADASPLAEAWRGGRRRCRRRRCTPTRCVPTPRPALAQLVRALGAGPANPVVDFVTRFDVEWHAAPACRAVRLAPDGSRGDATAGPAPPPAGVRRHRRGRQGRTARIATAPAAGPRLALRRLRPAGRRRSARSATARGVRRPRRRRGGTPISRASRASRCTLGVAVASARLRPPASVLLGERPRRARRARHHASSPSSCPASQRRSDDMTRAHETTQTRDSFCSRCCSGSACWPRWRWASRWRHRPSRRRPAPCTRS